LSRAHRQGRGLQALEISSPLDQTILDIILGRNYRSFEARAKVGRIWGTFSLLFQSAILVALSFPDDPAAACHENAPMPTPPLPAVETPKSPSFDTGEPFVAGRIPCNRYFAFPDLIGFRFEVSITLWPSILGESR
jgi:hypothetical protein